MSTLNENKKYIYGGYAGGKNRIGVHPEFAKLISPWEVDCRNSGLELRFNSGYRSTSSQAYLYSEYKHGRNGGRPAAKPGNSLHELGLAADVSVWDSSTNKFSSDNIELLSKVADIGKKYGLIWGISFNDPVHFECKFGRAKSSQLFKLRSEGKVDDQGYILLEPSDNIISDDNKEKSYSEQYKTGIGEQSIDTEEQEKEKEKREIPKIITKVEEFNAVGIWQIIKLVADQYSLSQNINDATISFDQGSLLNFIQKVVQEPWLEFFGDTVGDQYFFQVRKQPFDYNGWNQTLIDNDSIKIEDVLNDELNWYDGPVYSWYQIIPKGSFLGEQDLIFQYVSAVFFEEYAEVWGSKPLSIVSNYLNFIKISDGKIMLEKAFEDLRYMVESNCYLPFTRQGTITIKGDYRHRRGQKIIYFPTGEEFYVDSVSHSYQESESGPIFTTTLRVSRGMVMKYLSAPENKDSMSYWNLILYDNPPDNIIDSTEKVAKQSVQLYFDNNRSYLIDLNENFEGRSDTQSKKMQEQIEQFPQLRKQLAQSNALNIDKSVELIKNFPEAPLACVGYVDSDKGGKTPVLALQRAKTLKETIINAYVKKYNNITKEYLQDKISVRGEKITNYSSDGISEDKLLSKEEIAKQDNNRKLKLKSLERFANFVVDEHEKPIKKHIPQEGIGWKVNDPVFQFFLRRKQQNEC